MTKNKKNKKNLPALRFDPFITFFEQQVAEHQKQIETLRHLEPLYNTAKLALEQHKLSLSTRVTTHATTVSIYMELGDNHYRIVDPLLLTISEELTRLRLRDEATPPAKLLDVWNIDYVWYIHSGQTEAPARRLRISLAIPFDGNCYCEIKRTKKTREEYHYEPIWHDEPYKEKEQE